MALPRILEDAAVSVPKGTFSWGADAQRIGGGQIEVWITADGTEIARWRMLEPATLSEFLSTMLEELEQNVRIHGSDEQPKLRRNRPEPVLVNRRRI